MDTSSWSMADCKWLNQFSFDDLFEINFPFEIFIVTEKRVEIDDVKPKSSNLIWTVWSCLQASFE